MVRTQPWEVVCSGCGGRQGNVLTWRCDSCGGAYSILFKKPFDKRMVKKDDWSLWRYRPFLPHREKEYVTLGEGCTPLVPLGSSGVWAKLDYVMPTGSYKDRGTTLMVSSLLRFARDGRVKRVTEDSSGNAGASVAAYAAAAGITCEVFAPEQLVEQKAKQIESYGAKLTKVTGSRDKVFEAAVTAAKDSVYLSHIWNPYFSDGIRTLAYEIAEAFRWSPPDYVFLPVSAGTLLLGALRGFFHLFESGVIQKVPKIVACQTTQVSPLYHAWHGKHYVSPVRVVSVADALVTTRPIRLREMLSELRKNGGRVEAVDEDEIVASVKMLGARGLYVEPSAAVVHAAWRKLQTSSTLKAGSNVVLVLTGTGLKSPLKAGSTPASGLRS